MDEGARTGFELELLAPPGRSRDDLARLLAARTSSHPEVGFKLLRARLTADQQVEACCELTPCLRLFDAQGDQRLELVDDYSIVSGLSEDPRPHGHRLIMDDVRLATFAEARLRGLRESVELLAPLREVFGLEFDAPDSGPPSLSDRAGHIFGFWAPYSAERRRVTEVVTRPLTVSQRLGELTLIEQAALELGFVAAPEGGAHVHFDGQPWQTTRRLRQLIIAYSRARLPLLDALAPNPVSATWRGPWPDAVVEVALQSSDELPFPELAQRLLNSGLRKRCDLNVLGLVLPKPVRVTLEARMFPVLLSARALLEKVELFEGFLAEVARRADAR